LPSLRAKLAFLVDRYPEVRERVDLAAARRARDFWPFDDAATGPLHGFSGAADYYARSSSIDFVSRITTRTLCVSAEDDPFLPRGVLERLRACVAPSVELMITPTGGHVGFVAAGSRFRPRYWAEELVVDWLSAALTPR
jgi:predicted alpha/beta-fold hydrolase